VRAVIGLSKKLIAGVVQQPANLTGPVAVVYMNSATFRWKQALTNWAQPTLVYVHLLPLRNRETVVPLEIGAPDFLLLAKFLARWYWSTCSLLSSRHAFW